MSQSAQNTSLSLFARLLCYLGPLSVILLTSVASPRTGLLSPLAFAPTAWFYRKWRRFNAIDPSCRGELEPMVWSYAATGTVGIISAALIQLTAGSALSTLLFRSSQTGNEFVKEFQRSTIEGLTAGELARRAELASSWQNWVFLGVFTFGMAGLVEETLKYLPIAYAHRRDPEKRRNRAYIDYALAGALSFGVVEGIAFLYASCVKGHETGAQLLLTIFERIIAGSTGHLLMATLMALRAVRRDYYGENLSWWGVIGPAVLLHGAYDFVAMAFSTLEGNVGWIHPADVRNTSLMIGMCTGLVAAAGWLVRRDWKAIVARDQKRK